MTSLKKKKLLKRALMIAAGLIIAASLWYTNHLIQQMADEERRSVEIWAQSIHQKASLVKNTEEFFEQLREEERRKVELLAEATRRLLVADTTEDITFYSEIISSNTTIPVVLTDNKGKITSAKNVSFDPDTVDYLTGELKEEFSNYPPIVFDYYSGRIGTGMQSQNVNYYYYKDSKVFQQLQEYLDELINSFFSEVVINSASLPVIITDSSRQEVIASGNVPEPALEDSASLQQKLSVMRSENRPIRIDFTGYGTSFIFYRDSFILKQFRYYPYIQFGVIGLFIFLGYMVFSSARRSEQNQVWAGMAKETAHQLGTPLSSLMAWMEMLKMKNVDESIISEMEKDIFRLNHVTQRFSKIGSDVNLNEENIVPVIEEAVEYLKNRTSKTIEYSYGFRRDAVIVAPVNKYLFQWVIENLCKNAVDAMNGNGKVAIEIDEDEKWVYVDVADNGKGINREDLKHVFEPGYTSKKRGWGLGLTLARRIIEYYHKGRIMVKKSVPGQGSVFRIQLKKEHKNI